MAAGPPVVSGRGLFPDAALVQKYCPLTLAITSAGVPNVTVVPVELAPLGLSIVPSPKNFAPVVLNDADNVAPVPAVVVQDPLTPSCTSIPTDNGVVSETVTIGEKAVHEAPDKKPTVFITVPVCELVADSALADTTN